MNCQFRLAANFVRCSKSINWGLREIRLVLQGSVWEYPSRLWSCLTFVVQCICSVLWLRISSERSRKVQSPVFAFSRMWTTWRLRWESTCSRSDCELLMSWMWIVIHWYINYLVLTSYSESGLRIWNWPIHPYHLSAIWWSCCCFV